MTQNRQNFRKNLASKGFLFLGGVELEIVIRNLSITGLLVELETSENYADIKAVFEAINKTVTVDIYIPEMHLAGEAEIVRADKVDDIIYMGVEFKNISYDVDNLLYKRKSYRKIMTAPGHINFGGQIYQFNTRNASVDGLMIEIDETVLLEEGAMASFDFPRLELEGKAKVVWIEYDETGNTILGIQYVQMARSTIKGIPVFSKD